MESNESDPRDVAGPRRGASTDRIVALKDVVSRVVEIAKMTATDLAMLMGTEQGKDIASLKIVEDDGVTPESYLRSWDSIGRASPIPLTEQQYDRFLLGENPTISVEPKSLEIEIYGADLEREA
jgi:hypothetical protein